MPISRNDIVAEARKFVGVKWQHQGRTILGMDCVGVVIKTAHACALSDFDYTNYPRRGAPEEFMKYFYEHLDLVKINDFSLGNVITLRDSIQPCHCGIVAEKDGVVTLIHAHTTRGEVIEEPFSQEWLDKRIRMFSYRGVV